MLHYMVIGAHELRCAKWCKKEANILVLTWLSVMSETVNNSSLTADLEPDPRDLTYVKEKGAVPSKSTEKEDSSPSLISSNESSPLPTTARG